MAGLTLTLAAVPPNCSNIYNLHMVNAQTLSSGNTYTSGAFQVAAFSQIRYGVKGTLTGTTSPTFDFKVQALMPDGSTWDDIVRIAQQSATFTLQVVPLVNAPASSAGFAPGTSTNVSTIFTNAEGLTNFHRFVITIGGTNVSFATDVYMDAQ